MAVVSRNSLVPMVRLRADMANSQFVTDAEIQDNMDLSAKRLYDMVLQSFGQPPNSNYALLTYTPGLAYAQLPPDFYEMLGVYTQYNGTWYPLRPLSVETIPRDLNSVFYGYSPRYSYRLTGFQFGDAPAGIDSSGTPGQLLELSPVPINADVIRVDYIPVVVNNASPYNSDVTYEGYNGWEEWIVLRVAAFCMAKEESDPSFLLSEMARIERDIKALGMRRDMSQTRRIRDVEDSGFYTDPRLIPWPGRGW